MSTSDKYVALTEKRILGWQSLKEQFFDYISNNIKDLQMSYFSRSGTFSNINFAGDGVDKFKLVDYLTTKVAALDGFGNLLSPVERPTDVEDVVFANSLGVNYHVGIQRADIPSGFHINPADGLPFFDSYEEIIGYAKAPDLVSSNGMGGLTFRIDSVTQSAVSFQGRKVIVWKLAPGKEALTEADAIEECTVVFLSLHNVCGTVGTFGQGSTISTDPNDYRVALIGPRISTVSLVSDPECCYIGYITGAGAGVEPSVWDTTDQYVIDVSLVQLSEITRTEPSNARLKIDVKALAGESGIDQIRVTKLGTGVRFQVDENGNVEIQGNLIVRGTEQVHSTETVYSSETITGNLTAGDSDSGDSHTIKGTWLHTDTAGTANYFKINGVTGRIGIGMDPSGTETLQLTGTSKFVGNMTLQGTLLPSSTGYDIGAVGYLWDAFLQELKVYTTAEMTYFSVADTIGGNACLEVSGSLAYIRARNAILGMLRSAGGADEKNWGWQVDEDTSKEVLSLSTYNDSWVKTGLILKARRATNSTTVERIDFGGEAYIDVANYALCGANGSSSLGLSGARWPYLYTTNGNIDTLVINTSLVPDAPVGASIGNSSQFFTDVFARDHWAISAAGSANEPSMILQNGDATTGRRTWKTQVEDDGEFRLYTADNAGAALEPVLHFQRDATDPTKIAKMIFKTSWAGGHQLQLHHVGYARWTLQASGREFYLYERSDNDAVAYGPLMTVKWDSGLSEHTISLQTKTIFTYDAYPLVDNYADLGGASNRWQDFYCVSARPNKLLVGTGAGNGSETLEPITNDVSRTLGSSSYPWYRAYLERIVLGTDTGEGFESTVYPSADATYAIGSATRRFTTLNLESELRIFKTSASDTYIRIGSNSASNGVNWHFRSSSSGVLSIAACEADFVSGTADFLRFNRLAGDTAPVSIVSTTAFEATNLLSHTLSGGASIDFRAEAAAAGYESWRMLANSAGNFILYMAPDNLLTDGNPALGFTRGGGGSALTAMVIYDGASFNPDTNNTSTLGTNTYSFEKVFAGEYRVKQASVSADSGEISIGNSTASGTTGNGAVANAASYSSAGWLKWYLGSTAIYIPYWTQITT